MLVVFLMKVPYTCNYMIFIYYKVNNTITNEHKPMNESSGFRKLALRKQACNRKQPH